MAIKRILDLFGSDENESITGKRILPAGIKEELKATFSLAWPMVLTQLSQFMFPPIATMFCGHLGKIQLDAVALSNSLINVTGIWIIIGMSSACDTLFSQTFGSKNKTDLGMVLQRSILILLLALFPCWAIHVNAEALLIAVGQHPAVAKLAGEYMLIFMPGLFCFSLFVPISKYVQNQNIVIPNLLIGLISNGVCALSHYVLIFVLGMGCNGSAISQSVGYFSMLVLTLIYIRCSGMYEGTWSGWSKDCLKNWGSFVKLSMFGMIMLCVEWWTWEVAIFLSGILGTTDLGAQTIIFQIATLVYMFPLGVGIGASIRVGQHLGAGDGQAAKTATTAAFLIISISELVMALLVGCLKDHLPSVFTNVREVNELASRVLPILAVYMLFDGAGGVSNGILRGMGRQKLGAAIISAAYIIGLSWGVPVMMMTHLGIIGYWYALAVTLAIEAIAALIFIAILTDWDQQVKLALERTHIDNNECYPEIDETTSFIQDGDSYKKTLQSRLLALLLSLTFLFIGILIRGTL